jgi:hypothetical protein
MRAPAALLADNTRVVNVMRARRGIAITIARADRVELLNGDVVEFNGGMSNRSASISGRALG